MPTIPPPTEADLLIDLAESYAAYSPPFTPGEEYRMALLRRLAAAEADRDRAIEACRAAIRYDQSVAGSGARGDVLFTDSKIAYAESDALDELYADWIGKARAALAGRRTQPPVNLAGGFRPEEEPMPKPKSDLETLARWLHDAFSNSNAAKVKYKGKIAAWDDLDAREQYGYLDVACKLLTEPPAPLFLQTDEAV